MRGGDRLGCIDEQGKSPLDGDILDSAMRGPAIQAHAAIVGLDEVRRLFEIPIQHGHEVAAFTQRIAQQAGDGHLALEAMQTLAGQAELEDAAFPGLGMPGKPDFVAFGARQRGFQPPVGATRHDGTDLELTGSRDEFHGPARDRDDQSISDLGQRGHHILRVVTQCLAQFAHGVGQHRIDHEPARPAGRDQLFLGHRLAGMPQQVLQDLKRLSLQLDILSRNAQLPARFVELGIAERPAIRLGAGGALPLCARHDVLLRLSDSVV